MHKLLLLLLPLLLFVTGCANQAGENASLNGPILNAATRIGFKAAGNEPPWEFEVDLDKKMRFATREGEIIEIMAPVFNPIPPQDANLLNFYAGSEDGTLEVNIFREPCRAYGYQYPFTVSINVKPKGENKAKNFKGCGQYVGDYALNDVWILSSYNGTAVDAQKLPEGPPNLGFYVTQNRAFGFGGCNRFQTQAQIDQENDAITFQPLIATEKACPDMILETDYFAFLSNQVFNFEIKNNQLTLKNEATLLVFTRKES